VYIMWKEYTCTLYVEIVHVYIICGNSIRVQYAEIVCVFGNSICVHYVEIVHVYIICGNSVHVHYVEIVCMYIMWNSRRVHYVWK